MVEVKFMSFNIQGHAAKGRPDFLPKIAEVIAAAAPDVVGLQEVHVRTRVGQMDQGEILASLTGLNLQFGKSTPMNGGEYGNAVLTRGEVVASCVHPLPGSGEPRSVLQTDIRLGDANFTFFVTHLAAWGRLLRITRLQQIAHLGDVTARSRLPHVLVGDFNVPPAAEEIRILLAHGHLQVCGDTKEATFPMTRQRLDYAFCDAGWEYVSAEVIRRGPSDHWPIVITLRLRGAS